MSGGDGVSDTVATDLHRVFVFDLKSRARTCLKKTALWKNILYTRYGSSGRRSGRRSRRKCAECPLGRPCFPEARCAGKYRTHPRTTGPWRFYETETPACRLRKRRRGFACCRHQDIRSFVTSGLDGEGDVSFFKTPLTINSDSSSLREQNPSISSLLYSEKTWPSSVIVV